jgi:hypothetical protein
MANKCKHVNLSEIKKRLINVYKKDRDDTPILERLEDRFNVDLSKHYGNSKTIQVNSLFKKLKKLQKKGNDC